MATDAHLDWLEERVTATELRITRQLELIGHWRRLGHDTARREQQLHLLEQILQRWHQHRRDRLARLAQAEAEGRISPCDRPDRS